MKTTSWPNLQAPQKSLLLQDKQCALSLAVREGFLEVVRAILKWDPNMEWKGERLDNNLLHLAARMGHVRICQVLNKSNPKLMEMTNDEECTPLLSVLEMIVDKVRDVEYYDYDAESGNTQRDTR